MDVWQWWWPGFPGTLGPAQAPAALGPATAGPITVGPAMVDPAMSHPATADLLWWVLTHHDLLRSAVAKEKNRSNTG